MIYMVGILLGVDGDNLEMTRLLRKMNPKFQGKTEADFKSKQDLAEFKLYQQIKSDFDKTKEEFEGAYNQTKFFYDGFIALNKNAKSNLNLDVE